MSKILSLFLLLFFAAGMTVKGAANAFVLLLGLAAIPFIRGQWCADKDRLVLFLSLLALPLATILQMIAGMNGVSVKGLDAPLRFVFAGLSLWGLTRLPSRYFVLAMWGIFIGAFGFGVWGWLSKHVDAYRWVDVTRAWNGFSHPIAFGVYAILFSFWVFILPGDWLVRSDTKRKWFWVVKVLAISAALFAAYSSESRSAQFVMAGSFLLLFMCRMPMSSWKKAGFLAGLTLLALLVVSFSPDRISTRVREGATELQNYDDSLNTSMGMRVTMWRYAFTLVEQHPWAGVGRQGYYREVTKLINEKDGLQFISASPHPHNELLNFAVEFGILGIVIGLAIYVVPAFFFWRALNASDPILSFAATAGLITVLVQFLAGLFDTYFWIVSQTSFYGMSVVIFASMIFSRKRELGLS